MVEINKIYNEDCLEGMKRIDDKSIDCIICDLPYGTTQCKWDTVIPFKPLWEQYNRIIKDNGAIVLFGSEPFSSTLVYSNIKNFKYNWIWQKNKTTGFLNAKKQPLNDHETISVFYKKQCVYHPQMTVADKIYKRGFVNRHKSDCYGKETDFVQVDTGYRYPKRIQYFNNNDTQNQLHPTQKPVELIEYLNNDTNQNHEKQSIINDKNICRMLSLMNDDNNVNKIMSILGIKSDVVTLKVKEDIDDGYDERVVESVNFEDMNALRSYLVIKYKVPFNMASMDINSIWLDEDSDFYGYHFSIGDDE